MENELSKRLQQQMKFILEIDKLKGINRQTPLIDQSRPENDAEHSWHIAMMTVIFAEYASPEVNIYRVVQMLLIHDVVEIDAGDTFLYDNSTLASSKSEREHKAALRIYGILPSDLQSQLMLLWQEFEERTTPDAKFAASLDRLQPLLQNYFTAGSTWKKHGITSKQVLAKNRVIEEGSKALWKLAEGLIKDAVDRGYLKEN